MATSSSSSAARGGPLRWSRDRLVLDLIIVAWGTVLLLWAMNVWRAVGSIAFLLVAVSVGVYVFFSVIDIGRESGVLRGAGAAVILSLLMVVPAMFDPTTYDVFNIAKFTIVIIGSLLLLGVEVVRSVETGAAPRWRNGLQWLVIALLVSTVISTMVSINPRISLLGFYKSYDGLFAAVAMTLIFFSVADLLTVKDMKRALYTLYFGGGGMTVLYGFLQLHDRTLDGARWDWIPWGDALFKGSSIWGTFGNPNHLAGFLAILLPIGLVLFFIERNWKPRVLTVVIALLLLLEMLQTTTRGAWMAGFLAIPFLLLLLLPDIKARPKISAAMIGVLVIAIGGAAYALSGTNQILTQVKSIFDLGSLSSGTQRIELWKSAAEMGSDRPVFGFGPDTYRILFPSYQSDRFVSFFGPDQIANGPHNTFMNYLSTQGYVGLAAFVALIAYAFLRAFGAWRRYRRVERDGKGELAEDAWRNRVLLSGVTVAAFAYIVQGTFNVQQVGLTFIFWVLLALICVFAFDAGVPDSLNPRRLMTTADVVLEKRPRKARKDEPSPERRDPRVVVGAAVVTAIVVAWLSYSATAPMRADRVFLEAQGDQSRSTIQEFSPGLRREHLALSRDEVAKAMAINPWEAAYPEDLALLVYERARGFLDPDEGEAPQLERAIPLLHESIRLYEVALDLQPDNAYLWESYAQIQDRLAEVDPGDEAAEDLAKDGLRKAIEFNPKEPSFYQQLAGFYLEENDVESAREVLEDGIAATPRNSDLVELLDRIEQATSG